jgi:hypothetical protein
MEELALCTRLRERAFEPFVAALHHHTDRFFGREFERGFRLIAKKTTPALTEDGCFPRRQVSHEFPSNFQQRQ